MKKKNYEELNRLEWQEVRCWRPQSSVDCFVENVVMPAQIKLLTKFTHNK